MALKTIQIVLVHPNNMHRSRTSGENYGGNGQIQVHLENSQTVCG